MSKLLKIVFSLVIAAGAAAFATPAMSASGSGGGGGGGGNGGGGGSGGGGGTTTPAVGPLSGTWVLSSPVSSMTGTVTLTLNSAGTTYSGTMYFAAQNQAPDTTPYNFAGGFYPDGSVVFGYRRNGGNPGIQPVLLTGALSDDGSTITGSSTAFWPGSTFVMTKM